MKKLVKEPKPPLQLMRTCPDGTYVPLITTSGKELWACGECRELGSSCLRSSKESAELCCREKTCVCGALLCYNETECGTCRNVAWRQKLNADYEALPIVEYDGKSPLLCCSRFFDNMEALVEYLDYHDFSVETWPETAELCDAETVGSRASSRHLVEMIVEQLTEGFEEPDDVEIEDEGELRSYLEQWLQKQTAPLWTPNGKRVRVPKKEE